MQDFMQFGFSEEASELVNDFLDFGGTCMRPTGELYGISGGKCRKGSESEPAKKRSNLHMRAYIRLMKKAKERGKPADTSGYHSHHAFPSSIFTNKETADKHQVWLTHGEHFAAHHLVYQALKNRYGEKDQRTIKMGHAIARMATGKDNKKLSAKQYAAAMKVKGEVMRAKYADPEERKKQGERGVIAQNKPEVLAANRQRAVERYANPEEREAQRKRLKEAYERPEVKEKQKAAYTDGVKDKIREAAKEQWQNEGDRERMKQALRKGWDSEAREKLAATRRNMAWYNDGKNSIQVKKGDSVPDGYKAGRISKGWYVNKESKVTQSAKHPGEGWQKGRIWKG